MTDQRHIAFVCPRFAEGATVGGAETLLRKLAERTARNGCKVTFLTTCAENHFTWENSLPAGKRTVGPLTVQRFMVDDDRDVEAFLRVQTQISRGAEVSAGNQERWMKHSVNSEPLYRHLREKGDQYDRIVAGPYLFGLIYNAARIHPEKTLLVPCLHDEPFAYQPIMRNLFTSVRGFMFNSVPEQALAQRLFDVPAHRCSVVGMGMDPFEADPEAFAKRHGLDAPYVLYSGRREPLKGTPLLLDFMAAFRERTDKDVKVVLTGSGPFDVPPELADHLLDVGLVPEEEKQEAMAGACVFCHPGTLESFGIVILEAWLAGTPALVHAGSEVLRFQCRSSNGGLWFRSYPEFEAELLLLLDRPDLNRKMAAAGREYVLNEYTWEAVEQRLLDALENTGGST